MPAHACLLNLPAGAWLKLPTSKGLAIQGTMRSSISEKNASEVSSDTQKKELIPVTFHRAKFFWLKSLGFGEHA